MVDKQGDNDGKCGWTRVSGGEEYRISNKEFRMKKVETPAVLNLRNTDATTSIF
jgi:hypothetical protein